MSEKLLDKFRKEGPHGLSYEELFVLILGDECAEEVRLLVAKGKTMKGIKELVGQDMEPMPGVRRSVMDRLYAMKALGVVWFG